MSGFWTCYECGAEMYGFENCQFCGAHKGGGEAMSVQTCHATQANYEHCKYSTNRGWCDTSRYAELFGTPERAAQTMALQCFGATSEACDTCVFGECDGKLRNSGAYPTVYDALLEWLMGDA